MTEIIRPLAMICTAVIETLGISIITTVAIYVLFFSLYRVIKGEMCGNVLLQIRQQLGGGILLGLEFLIAADIIQTVAIELTFKSVGVLAVIVLIRTFLSFTLELELEGIWPWERQCDPID
jgi:uncharacterized membrane protein